MNIKITIWIRGFISAVVSGIAVSIGAMVTSPAEFNFETGSRKLLTVAVVSGIVGAANYLRQSPIPVKKI